MHRDSEVVNGGITHGNEGIKLVDVSQFCVAVEQQCCVVCVGYPLLMESLRNVINKDYYDMYRPSSSANLQVICQVVDTLSIKELVVRGRHDNSHQWQPQVLPSG